MLGTGFMFRGVLLRLGEGCLRLGGAGCHSSSSACCCCCLFRSIILANAGSILSVGCELCNHSEFRFLDSHLNLPAWSRRWFRGKRTHHNLTLLPNTLVLSITFCGILRKKEKTKKNSLLQSSLVFIFRCSSPTTNPVCERRVNLLVYSISLHRHSYIGFILAFTSSIHNKQTTSRCVWSDLLTSHPEVHFDQQRGIWNLKRVTLECGTWNVECGIWNVERVMLERTVWDCVMLEWGTWNVESTDNMSTSTNF